MALLAPCRFVRTGCCCESNLLLKPKDNNTSKIIYAHEKFRYIVHKAGTSQKVGSLTQNINDIYERIIIIGKISLCLPQKAFVTRNRLSTYYEMVASEAAGYLRLVSRGLEFLWTFTVYLYCF